MPVTIAVAPNEAFEVEIRRDGFYPKAVQIDGTRPVLVVQLAPIPGVVPAVPVPSASPLEALRRTPEPGARAVAQALLHANPALAFPSRDGGLRSGAAAPSSIQLAPPPPAPPSTAAAALASALGAPFSPIVPQESASPPLPSPPAPSAN